MHEANKLKELARIFFKLGLTGFGGPAVHIAMMEEEIVRKQQWLSEDKLLDLVGATNLIPGPNSTELAMHIGQERAGRIGLIVAGACFIFPAVIITAMIAWGYQRYGTLPELQSWLYGIKPAVLAVIAALMIKLGKKAVKSVMLGIMGILAGLLVVLGVNEILVLFGCGLAGVLVRLGSEKDGKWRMLSPFFLLQIHAYASPGTLRIFLLFLKVGSILYGSGYVLFGFLDAELVSRGLISKQVLADAIAVGQFTPGPVFSSATFIGWQMGGFGAAAAATLGIFLPGFLFVALLNPLIPKLRNSAIMSAFLDAVNVASVAVILGVCIEITKASHTDWRSLVILVAGFILTWRFKQLNTAWIIAGGALAGYLLSFFS